VKELTEWRKIFANRMSNKDSYPKDIKNSYNSIGEKEPEITEFF
jgi:hypothetical protein